MSWITIIIYILNIESVTKMVIYFFNQNKSETQVDNSYVVNDFKINFRKAGKIKQNKKKNLKNNFEDYF